jgi:Tfp pilus assembly protein PilX
MSKRKSILHNEEGSLLVVVIVVLAVLSIVGISTMDKSQVELQIVRNEAVYNRNFYAAEGAAIEAAQTMQNQNDSRELLPNTTSYTWLGDLTDVDWTTQGNKIVVDIADVDALADVSTIAHTEIAAVHRGVASGASMAMTAVSQVHEYAVFGYYNSAKEGRALIEIGYRKRIQL